MVTGTMELETKDHITGEAYGFVRMMDVDAGLGRNSIDDELEEWIQSMAADCDKNMSDVTEEDVANALGNGEVGNLSEGRSKFAALDREILSILNASGGNQSTKNDTWSRRRFDEWRLQNGMPTSVPIETMDLKDLADQLPIFFRQVMKHNGDHYPLESLLGFYRGFTRIMQKAQEARICETRVIEMPFCMRSHALFGETGVALLEAMRHSVLACTNKRRKKSVVISWANEQALLADKDHQATHPYGCFRRWAYYCISRFMIRSGKELYNVTDCDFQERKDENGDCVVYGEILSMNNEASTSIIPISTAHTKATRIASKRMKVEPLRVPVKCHQGDVIHTYRQFMKHQPVKVGEEVGKPRHLFLQPIGNPVTNAWFAKSHVSERVLVTIFKTMAVIAGVNVKDNSNKPGRLTITSSSMDDASMLIGIRDSVTTGISSNVFNDRYTTNVARNGDAAESVIDKVSDLMAGKRNFQEAFGKTSSKIDDAQQNSSGASSVKSVQLLAVDPDPVSGSVVYGVSLKEDSEVLVGSDEKHAAIFAIQAPGQCILSKLQIAQSQFKDLESILFDKISLKGGGAATMTGQSLRDLVQVAMSQLKGLEATLSSMISIL